MIGQIGIGMPYFFQDISLFRPIYSSVKALLSLGQSRVGQTTLGRGVVGQIRKGRGLGVFLLCMLGCIMLMQVIIDYGILNQEGDNILYAKLMCWLGYANDRLVQDRVYQDMLCMIILGNIRDKGCQEYALYQIIPEYGRLNQIVRLIQGGIYLFVYNILGY